MKNFLMNNFLYLFIAIVAVDLYANIINSFVLNIYFKPLIVISLLIYLYATKSAKTPSVTIAAAGLVFSLGGDILLTNSYLFVFGLVSFLIAHIFYIIYYIRSSGTATKTLKNKALYFILIIIYGASFYSLLFENLHDNLKTPVLLYTCVLMGMSVFAINRFGKVNSESFKLILIGAILFTISDSILALNKFLQSIPLAGVWIMATYAAAQYFITKGVLANSEEVKIENK